MPIIKSAKIGDVQEVKLALRRRENIETRDPEEHATALHWAASGNNWNMDREHRSQYMRILHHLLQENANIEARHQNMRNRDSTPLLWAAAFGHVRAVLALLAYGANPNARNILGSTPRTIANFNKVNRWPAYARNFDKVIDMLEYAGNINQFLIFACEIGDIKTVRKLIERNADINFRDVRINRTQGTPLGMASFYGHLPIVNLLIAQGARLEQRNGSQNTPLILAAASGQEEIINILLEAGADINARGASNFTALERANQNNQQDSVRALNNHTLNNTTNRVTVYIWSSKNSNENGSIWHTSLRTHAGGSTGIGYYVSLFQAQVVRDEDNDGRHVFSEDVDALGEPDIIYNLYTLNVEVINRRYEELGGARNAVSYSFFGSVEIELLRGEGRNCCGLVVDLLRSGGIDNLVEYYSQTFGHMGMATGVVGGGAFFSSTAVVGVLSVAALTPAGVLAALLVIGGAASFGAITGGISGHLTGRSMGEIIDTAECIRNITTPNGVATLVSYARKSENSIQETANQEPINSSISLSI